MVNIKKTLLTAAYLTSFSVALPSQPNYPEQANAPADPIFDFIPKPSSFIPSFIKDLFSSNGKSSEAGSSYTEQFWKLVAENQGYIPDQDTLNALGIPTDSKLYDQYSEFFNKFSTDIFDGKAAGAAVSAALDYAKSAKSS